MTILQDIALAPLTTMQVGGRARFFCACRSVEDIREGLDWAAERHMPVHVLGSGSNTIFSDEGFDGLVMRIELGGVVHQAGSDEEVEVCVGAGEDWDSLVLSCIDAGLSGIECLSGIPGSVGATPMQNVGAYGQEVSQTIALVRGLERQTLRQVEFANDKCAFTYRHSRFKGEDRDRFIITEVIFRLRRNAAPEVRYAELRRHLQERTGVDPDRMSPGREAATAVREAVLSLRRRKSMVLDPSDANSRSVGSFFLNPVLARADFDELQDRWLQAGGNGKIPSFAAAGGVKIPAAWLVEESGFSKGFVHRTAAISSNHALALVSTEGTSARDIVELGQRIQRGVEERFGVRLQREPVLVGPTDASAAPHIS